MPNEISKEEAENRLEAAVKNFDWLKEFLIYANGNNRKQNVLDDYRALHAQLREGDKLEIKISKMENNCSRCGGGFVPEFDIILVKSNGEEEIISQYSCHVSFLRSNNLLYSDK